MNTFKYRPPTVIVVGSGRSGTSTVAKILHEHFKICMGHFFKEHRLDNPYCHHECLFAHGLNRIIVEGGIEFEEWSINMNKVHKDCPTWGVKDPWFLNFDMYDQRRVDPKLIIRTWRPVDETIRSWMRVKKLQGRFGNEFMHEYFRDLIEGRHKLMEEKLKGMNCLDISFTTENRKSSAQIIEELTPALEKVL